MARLPTERLRGLAHALYVAAKPPAFVSRAPTLRGVRYSDRGGRGVPPLCDVYLPDGKRGASVVLVHGGGFFVGRRDMKPVRFVATRLVEAGHAVCSVDYRLVLRGGGLDRQLEDVDAAARYWRQRCADHGCDRSRVAVVGLSAGAALMLLHAGRDRHPYTHLVSIFGPLELDRMGEGTGPWLRLVTGTTNRAEWHQRSPARVADHPAPLLMVHGTADELVPYEQAERLLRWRAERGLPTELATFEGMPHGWLNDASLPESRGALDRIIGFLGRGVES